MQMPLAPGGEERLRCCRLRPQVENLLLPGEPAPHLEPPGKDVAAPSQTLPFALILSRKPLVDFLTHLEVLVL